MVEGYTLRESVLRTFLSNPTLRPIEMADHLEAKYNSVKAVFSKLCEEGLLRREGRGNYVPNTPGIFLYIMDKIESLENNRT